LTAQRSKIQLLIAEVERGAYQRGLDDAARAINQALAKLGARNLTRDASGKSESRRSSSSNRTANGFVVRPNSDSALVLQAIRVHPGQRGSEIHRLLGTGEKPINERTMRTALRRLSRRGVIEQRDGRWYERMQLPDATQELAKELKLGGGLD
jgi:hypothetical protein